MFKSGRDLAIATMALLAVKAGLEAANGVALMLLIDSNFALRSTLRWLLVPVTRLDLLLLVPTAVAFSMWIYRAVANLPAIGSKSLKFSPSSAVWQFYIPLVNLIRGREVMVHIWTESQPHPGPELQLARRRASPLIDLWWVAWVGGNISGSLSMRLTTGPSADRLIVVALFQIVHALAAILCIVLVHRADRRQHAMWDDIVRRANVPQPTGMELR